MSAGAALRIARAWVPLLLLAMGQVYAVERMPHAPSRNRMAQRGNEEQKGNPIANEPGQQQQTASKRDDQQDRKDNNDAQGRRIPGACGAAARWSWRRRITMR